MAAMLHGWLAFMEQYNHDQSNIWPVYIEQKHRTFANRVQGDDSI